MKLAQLHEEWGWAARGEDPPKKSKSIEKEHPKTKQEQEKEDLAMLKRNTEHQPKRTRPKGKRLRHMTTDELADDLLAQQRLANRKPFFPED